ncbi:histone-lysine N-methyltransferase SETMAR [Trichonephila clavipes]|nr:histone-lysine N-methyltransferase SETMAR [Trichonephila clavipes]
MQSSEKKKRGVFRFVSAEGVGGRGMHGRMKAEYDEYSLCRSSAVEWRKRFLEGPELLEGDPRPGQAHRVIKPEMIEEVNTLVLNNSRITVRDPSVTWC